MYIKENGHSITVVFTNTNTASNITLNINNTGAYPVKYNNVQFDMIVSGVPYNFVYINEAYVIVSSMWG